MKKKKEKELNLKLVIASYKKKGMTSKEANKAAKIFMMGYTAAKKGSVNISIAKKWSKRDKFGRIKKKK